MEPRDELPFYTSHLDWSKTVESETKTLEKNHRVSNSILDSIAYSGDLFLSYTAVLLLIIVNCCYLGSPLSVISVLLYGEKVARNLTADIEFMSFHIGFGLILIWIKLLLNQLEKQELL
jgi:hypothetical protein